MQAGQKGAGDGWARCRAESFLYVLLSFLDTTHEARCRVGSFLYVLLLFWRPHMRGRGQEGIQTTGKREQGTAGQNVKLGFFSMYYFHSADHISGEGESRGPAGQKGAGDDLARGRAGSFFNAGRARGRRGRLGKMTSRVISLCTTSVLETPQKGGGQ